MEIERVDTQRAYERVLEKIARLELLAGGAGDPRQLFDLDHKFHRAIAQAAGNKYLAQTLDVFYGLSLRLWYLVLPHLQFLPGAVSKHLDIVDAVRKGDADAAERVMSEHVAEFYGKVRDALESRQ